MKAHFPVIDELLRDSSTNTSMAEVCVHRILIVRPFCCFPLPPTVASASRLESWALANIACGVALFRGLQAVLLN